jgi:hypothetical protein
MRMTPFGMAKAQKATRSSIRDENGRPRGLSFRAEVSELISQQSLTSARQTFDALASKYPDLTAAQKTTIYGVLKDLGYGRSPKQREHTTQPVLQAASGASATPTLASLIAEADPSTIRAELASLREKQARVARSIKALEMLLGE